MLEVIVLHFTKRLGALDFEFSPGSTGAVKAKLRKVKKIYN